jgi:hypothetical protein
MERREAIRYAELIVDSISCSGRPAPSRRAAAGTAGIERHPRWLGGQRHMPAPIGGAGKGITRRPASTTHVVCDGSTTATVIPAPDPRPDPPAESNDVN